MLPHRLDCFPDLSPQEGWRRLPIWNYSAVEIPIHESGRGLKPSDVHADLERAARFCRDTHRLDIAALDIELAPGPIITRTSLRAASWRRLIKVVSLVIPCSELGTPFNEEIERLRKLVEIASLEGAVVGLKTQIGRMSQDPDTACVLCDNVKGLRLTLDPSHYVTGPHQGGAHRQSDEVRAARAPARFNEAEAARARRPRRDRLRQADFSNWTRSATIGRCRSHMTPLEGFDHRAEMRKMRLLLDSLL